MEGLKLQHSEKLLCYVKKHADDTPDKTAINFYGRQITYQELDDLSDRLATAIADMGYKKGDRVAAFLQTSPQCYVLYLAAMKLGLIIAPIDPMSKELELEYALNDSGARLIVAFDQVYPVVESVEDRCELKDVIVTSFSDYLPRKPTISLHKMMKPPKQRFPDTYEFSDLVRKYTPHPPKVDVRSDDYAWILYTGGTTGLPKGCLHTQYDLALSAWGWSQLGYECTSEDVLLISWPHTHISGISHGLAPTLFSGMTIIPLARWDALAAMEAISKYKVTLLHWAVPQFWDVINHPDRQNYDLTSLKRAFVAPFAIPITDDLVKKWRELTGCPLYDSGYGSSEHMNYVSHGTGLTFPKRPPCTTFGRLAPGVQIKIVDFETGKELPEGEEGEIVTKEPAQLKRYWNKPEENKRDIVDGWLHTHDRGYIKEGVLYFMGKASDVCKVRGYTVSLKEVETYGVMHSAVDRIAVIALPDPKSGSRLKAFVILKPGTKLTAPELEEWFKEKVAVFKRPTIEIRKELPTSSKGEILKRELVKEELGKIGKES